MVAIISAGTLRMLSRTMSAAVFRGCSADDPAHANWLSQASRVRPSAAAFALSAAACSSGSSITVIRNPPRLHRTSADVVDADADVDPGGAAVAASAFGFQDRKCLACWWALVLLAVLADCWERR